ncbi:MAG: NADAR family protein [Bacteroidetes bacterium]|nr:NADAR family protein [Bacteroidota bacterium]
MKYSVEWLKAEIADHKTKDYLFFWGHRATRKGVISKTCFSQWWPAAFKENDTMYQTAEHYMMVSKARLFKDDEIAGKILAKENPKDAKDLGRQIRNFDATVWDNKKYNIVKQGNFLKFSQHEDLSLFLRKTGSKILVEASPVDPIWGIGLSEDHSDALTPHHWKGQNLLGFALMEVRDELNKL